MRRTRTRPSAFARLGRTAYDSRVMAYSVVYTVDVTAPPSRVFDYVADVSRHGEWASADDHMKAIAEKPGQPAIVSATRPWGSVSARQGRRGRSTVSRPNRSSPSPPSTRRSEWPLYGKGPIG